MPKRIVLALFLLPIWKTAIVSAQINSNMFRWTNRTQQEARDERNGYNNGHDNSHVVVNSPATADWLSDDVSPTADYTVRVGVKSKSQVTDVRVTVNGQTSRGINSVKNDGYDMSVNQTVRLNEGNNLIELYVTNAGGTTKFVKNVRRQSNSTLAVIDWLSFSPTTTQKQYTVKAGIKSDSKIDAWKVTINDVVDRGINAVRNDSYAMTINKTLSLAEGNNTIKIEVTNAGGTAVAEKSVIYNPNNGGAVTREKRIALVMGNSKYESPKFSTLPNTVNDAKAMYAKLQTLGFDMEPLVLNASRVEMWNAIDRFTDRIDGGNYEVALIYYSGHGLSPDGGANYIIPVDANTSYLDEVKRDGINSQTELIQKLEKKRCRVKIALLDCCNSCNLPERGTRNAAFQGGLSKVNPEGVFILHAAHPGRVSYDGKDVTSKNSPFAEAFIECINEHPNQLWELLVKDIIESVEEKTNGAQVPYPEGVIKGKFILNNQ